MSELAEMKAVDSRQRDDDELRVRGIITGGRKFSPADRAVGHTDDDQLKNYWTKGEGLAKWAKGPHPWTSLYHHLIKFLGPERAKRVAAQWFHEVFGFWPGSDLNRVTHGKPPRGKKVGPG